MAPLVPDDLRRAIEPLLPPERPRPKGGRPRASDRAALAGILFVLRTGIRWHAVGVWTGLHRVLLEHLGAAGQIDWRRAGLDSASMAANVWLAPSASGFGDPA